MKIEKSCFNYFTLRPGLIRSLKWPANFCLANWEYLSIPNLWIAARTLSWYVSVIKTYTAGVVKFIMIYPPTMSKDLWRLEGPCINSVAVVFERVNMFSQVCCRDVKRSRKFIALPLDGTFTETYQWLIDPWFWLKVIYFYNNITLNFVEVKVCPTFSQ